MTAVTSEQARPASPVSPYAAAPGRPAVTSEGSSNPFAPASDEVAPEVGFAWVKEGGRKYLGYILLGVGTLMLIFGWYGAAGESVVAKQIPYLASGGLGGVAFIVVGGRVLLIDDLRRDSGRLDRVELMVQELHAVLLAKASEDKFVGATTSTSEHTGPVAFEVVSGGTTYHLPGCAMTEGKRRSNVTAAAVAKRGLTPCPLCEPGEVAAALA